MKFPGNSLTQAGSIGNLNSCGGHYSEKEKKKKRSGAV